MRNQVVLNGAQKQYLMAAATAQSLDYATFGTAVEECLVGIVAHRNGRPSNVQLQAAIDVALSEL